MMNNKVFMPLILLPLALYGIFVAAPDPTLRGVALWTLVLLGLASSLLLSWRDLNKP